MGTAGAVEQRSCEVIRTSISRSDPPSHNTGMAKSFKHPSVREILALAIALEEEDARIYVDFQDGFPPG